MPWFNTWVRIPFDADGDMIDDFYPLPNRVGTYGTLDEFKKCRPQDGQWVFWKDRVDLVLEGRYDEVKPLHVELSPTYLCNFGCPWCSCRAAREEWAETDVFHHARATDTTVATESRLVQILQNLANDSVGIMWVGGEPTMHPGLCKIAQLAHELKLKQCLFTNGSILQAPQIRQLFEADLEFIRFSLDAVTEATHRVFHDYRNNRNYGRVVQKAIAVALAERTSSGARTLIGVSVVIDKRNYEDLIPTLEYVASLSHKSQRGIDYVIVRPAFAFYKSEVELEAGMTLRLADTLRKDSAICRRLSSAGVELIAPTGSFEQPDTADRTGLRGPCRSSGWFSEVTPSGGMLLCSDCYGNPEFLVGNIASSTLKDIWQSQQRRNVIRMTAETSCMANHCPKNGRGFHLNRIFSQIESFRHRGELHNVQNWIEALRLALPRPAHPFFL